MVTIRMIAQKCGCSTATVSKALNGAPDVSADTAERIRKSAAEMGYMPNAAARALKTSRSYSFGVLYEDSSDSGLTHEYFSLMINSFKRRAESLGYDICFISDRLGGRAISFAEHARYRNCDGVMVALVDFSDPAILDLINSGIPVVTIDYVFETCGSVQSDNFQGMRDLVTHIYNLGHRRIAFIHGEETAVTKIRIASFYRICRELGLELPEDYVLEANYHAPDSVRAAARKLMAHKSPPTCILFPDDISILGGINELEKIGFSVPGEVSVAGYDGIKFSQILRPKLTTLKQDAERIGIAAAEELARAVDEGKLYIPGRIVIPGKVLPGATVIPFPSQQL